MKWEISKSSHESLQTIKYIINYKLTRFCFWSKLYSCLIMSVSHFRSWEKFHCPLSLRRVVIWNDCYVWQCCDFQYVKHDLFCLFRFNVRLAGGSCYKNKPIFSSWNVSSVLLFQFDFVTLVGTRAREHLHYQLLII